MIKGGCLWIIVIAVSLNAVESSNEFSYDCLSQSKNNDLVQIAETDKSISSNLILIKEVFNTYFSCETRSLHGDIATRGISTKFKEYFLNVALACCSFSPYLVSVIEALKALIAYAEKYKFEPDFSCQQCLSGKFSYVEFFKLLLDSDLQNMRVGSEQASTLIPIYDKMKKFLEDENTVGLATLMDITFKNGIVLAPACSACKASVWINPFVQPALQDNIQ
ncbi:hypothetical protein FJ364_04160 [Candidatus Dependentiae bacterium]|nr:hypothetical protein [Candidatus Dependentiae bacterium]